MDQQSFGNLIPELIDVATGAVTMPEGDAVSVNTFSINLLKEL